MIAGLLLGPVAVTVWLAKLRCCGTVLPERALPDLYRGHLLPAPLMELLALPTP